FDARKADFQTIAVGTDGKDVSCGTRRLWRTDDGLRREIEGDAENVRVFHGEKVVLIEIIRLAAKAATDNLFAQQLRSECTHAENMGDRIRIPTLGEHRD